MELLIVSFIAGSVLFVHSRIAHWYWGYYVRSRKIGYALPVGLWHHPR